MRHNERPYCNSRRRTSIGDDAFTGLCDMITGKCYPGVCRSTCGVCEAIVSNMTGDPYSVCFAFCVEIDEVLIYQWLLRCENKIAKIFCTGCLLLSCCLLFMYYQRIVFCSILFAKSSA